MKIVLNSISEIKSLAGGEYNLVENNVEIIPKSEKIVVEL